MSNMVRLLNETCALSLCWMLRFCRAVNVQYGTLQHALICFLVSLGCKDRYLHQLLHVTTFTIAIKHKIGPDAANNLRHEWSDAYRNYLLKKEHIL